MKVGIALHLEGLPCQCLFI